MKTSFALALEGKVCVPGAQEKWRASIFVLAPKGKRPKSCVSLFSFCALYGARRKRHFQNCLAPKCSLLELRHFAVEYQNFPENFESHEIVLTGKQTVLFLIVKTEIWKKIRKVEAGTCFAVNFLIIWKAHWRHQVQTRHTRRLCRISVGVPRRPSLASTEMVLSFKFEVLFMVKKDLLFAICPKSVWKLGAWNRKRKRNTQCHFRVKYWGHIRRSSLPCRPYQGSSVRGLRCSLVPESVVLAASAFFFGRTSITIPSTELLFLPDNRNYRFVTKGQRQLRTREAENFSFLPKSAKNSEPHC